VKIIYTDDTFIYFKSLFGRLYYTIVGSKKLKRVKRAK